MKKLSRPTLVCEIVANSGTIVPPFVFADTTNNSSEFKELIWTICQRMLKELISEIFDLMSQHSIQTVEKATYVRILGVNEKKFVTDNLTVDEIASWVINNISHNKEYLVIEIYKLLKAPKGSHYYDDPKTHISSLIFGWNCE